MYAANVSGITETMLSLERAINEFTLHPAAMQGLMA